MNGGHWVHVDERKLVMFVLDEYGDTVLEDIIPHDQPKLAAAETHLASFGWRRMGDWEKVALHWTAEVERA